MTPVGLQSSITKLTYLGANSIDDADSIEAKTILKELENIDDECDDLNIDFVKISDPGVATTFKLAKLPSLIYYRKGEANLFEGDLLDEESVLKWVIGTKEATPDVIEPIDAESLEAIIDAKTNVVVFFCK